MHANISNAVRKAIYRRDHYRCALCDSSDGIQIHHAIPRGQGGNNTPHNLITLCWRCHAEAHGTPVRGGTDFTPEDIAQACVEYLADEYAPRWWPYKGET